MKISSSVVIFASADALFRAPKGTDANGNKINGRHPQRRLQSINKFLCGWFNQNVGGAKADRMCDRLTSQIEQYDGAFNRPTCAFFDPSVKNGGPNPDESMRGMRPAKNPKARNAFKARQIRSRRSDEDNYEPEEEDFEALEDCDGTETGALKEFCEEGQDDAVSRSVSVQQRKLKRYTTSLIKWCGRYISECHGQRVHEHCVNRGLKLYKGLKDME